jgi:hypothetical protein
MQGENSRVRFPRAGRLLKGAKRNSQAGDTLACTKEKYAKVAKAIERIGSVRGRLEFIVEEQKLLKKDDVIVVVKNAIRDLGKARRNLKSVM